MGLVRELKERKNFTCSDQNLISVRFSTTCSSLIDVKPNILAALKSQRPVVALESTIITHGMPYPHNLETAAEVEEIIRQEVCIPNIQRQKKFLTRNKTKIECHSSYNCNFKWSYQSGIVDRRIEDVGQMR